eukprot:CAMPEP_0184289326 /NCGR_PEP_ID=MMETSP1049-20130417/1782_1 /TAXON_ID=77928 /ORGANISM="Proteomonas sulcata, Strain CCMP704" /LENGTH=117 /DNA_ID=CAMNT_0026596071 /DNA_START=357 /DNA_END=710 /DNA_ORIENTATION=-
MGRTNSTIAEKSLSESLSSLSLQSPAASGAKTRSIGLSKSERQRDSSSTTLANPARSASPSRTILTPEEKEAKRKAISVTLALVDPDECLDPFERQLPSFDDRNVAVSRWMDSSPGL